MARHNRHIKEMGAIVSSFKIICKIISLQYMNYVQISNPTYWDSNNQCDFFSFFVRNFVRIKLMIFWFEFPLTIPYVFFMSPTLAKHNFLSKKNYHRLFSFRHFKNTLFCNTCTIKIKIQIGTFSFSNNNCLKQI